MVFDNAKSTPYSLPIIFEGEMFDHRKRRRNRMRASCLNCYASKRKCDKKRPCTRCVRLGTTGLCVYEVEDPVKRDETHLDEIKRLRHRIAELESVVRELKNKPHPRWTAPGGVVHNPDFVHHKSTSQAKTDNVRLSTEDAVADEALVDVKVEAEENRPCTSDLNTPANASLQESSHTSLNRSWSAIRSPTVLRTVPSDRRITSVLSSSLPFDMGKELHHGYPKLSLEIFNSESSLYSTSHSSEPMTVCSPSASDSSDDGLPPSISPLHPTEATTFPSSSRDLSQALPPKLSSNTGIQAYSVPSVLASVSPTASPQATETSKAICNCLSASVAFEPLVHLGVALRTSREALEGLHSRNSDCMLFCRIAVLEDHIFSVSPAEQTLSLKSTLSHDPSIPSHPALDSNVTPYTPFRQAHDYALPPSYSHSTPAYPSTHRYHQSPPRTPDPFAYLSDITGHAPFHTWG